MKKILFVLLLSFVFANVVNADQAKTHNFNGTVGDNQIKMILSIQKQGFITGSYNYVSQKKPIYIDGILKDNGMLILYEYDQKQQSAIFIGKATDWGEFVGTWASPDASYKFRLFLQDKEHSI